MSHGAVPSNGRALTRSRLWRGVLADYLHGWSLVGLGVLAVAWVVNATMTMGSWAGSLAAFAVLMAALLAPPLDSWVLRVMAGAVVLAVLIWVEPLPPSPLPDLQVPEFAGPSHAGWMRAWELQHLALWLPLSSALAELVHLARLGVRVVRYRAR